VALESHEYCAPTQYHDDPTDRGDNSPSSIICPARNGADYERDYCSEKQPGEPSANLNLSIFSDLTTTCCQSERESSKHDEGSDGAGDGDGKRDPSACKAGKNPDRKVNARDKGAPE